MPEIKLHQAAGVEAQHRASPGEHGTPIFILGIMPRSGTNFLHRLLCRHPECGAVNTTPVREDYLTHHSARLGEFVDKLRWQWGHWGADNAFTNQLAAKMGQGVISFLESLTDKPRVVTKTPSVRHLAHFRRFFPDAHLLVIVRDGRSVVASGMEGLNWNFETAVRRWVEAARTVLQAKESSDTAFQVVYYEQLNEQTAGQIKQILAALGLPDTAYDYQAALDIPVYGSSFMKEEGAGVSWQPKEKPEGFDSSARWRHWTTAQLARFNWLAGNELEALGYEVIGPRPDGIAALPHRAMDFLYEAKRLPSRVYQSLKTGMKAGLVFFNESKAAHRKR